MSRTRTSRTSAQPSENVGAPGSGAPNLSEEVAMDLESIRAVAAHEVNRRRLLQGVGLAAGAGVLGLTTSDPVYAATTGYDLAKGYVAGNYRAPRGVAGKSPAKDTALAWINDNSAAVTGLSDQIWQFAELSLREWQSSLAAANILSRNGFKIEWGTAGLPAAFIATFQQGSGGPVLGFNGEYDALPGLSQRQGSSVHDPLVYNSTPTPRPTVPATATRITPWVRPPRARRSPRRRRSEGTG
ncbi:MAG TPA: twin-arginine translocation signal domain-containing protein [Nakamurella sp.]